MPGLGVVHRGACATCRAYGDHANADGGRSPTFRAALRAGNAVESERDDWDRERTRLMMEIRNLGSANDVLRKDNDRLLATRQELQERCAALEVALEKLNEYYTKTAASDAPVIIMGEFISNPVSVPFILHYFNSAQSATKV